MKFTKKGLRALARFWVANSGVGLSSSVLLEDVREAVINSFYDRKWSCNYYPDVALELVTFPWGKSRVIGFPLNLGLEDERYFWADYATSSRKVWLESGYDFLGWADNPEEVE